MREATPEESKLLRRFVGHIRSDYETIREGRPGEALKWEWTTSVCGIPIRLHFYSREMGYVAKDSFQLLTPGFRFSGWQAGDEVRDTLLIHSTDEKFDHEMLLIKMAL